jgi:hypothetical protein
VESLRSVFFKMDRSTKKAHDRPFDKKAHDRPFDKKAHDRQNTLFDVGRSTCPQCLETGVRQIE